VKTVDHGLDKLFPAQPRTPAALRNTAPRWSNGGDRHGVTAWSHSGQS
jgi:hypothetical protein